MTQRTQDPLPTEKLCYTFQPTRSLSLARPVMRWRRIPAPAPPRSVLVPPCEDRACLLTGWVAVNMISADQEIEI